MARVDRTISQETSRPAGGAPAPAGARRTGGPATSAAGARQGTVDVQGVTVCYEDSNRQKQTVLSDVSFTVPGGTFATIVGPSGSGKSTLLKVIGGLQLPESGSVTEIGRESCRERV